MHGGDEEFGRLDDDDAASQQPVPVPVPPAPENNEAPRVPTITKHPYLSSEYQSQSQSFESF